MSVLSGKFKKKILLHEICACVQRDSELIQDTCNMRKELAEGHSKTIVRRDKSCRVKHFLLRTMGKS